MRKTKRLTKMVSEASDPDPDPDPGPKCSMGNYANFCCSGNPWETLKGINNRGLSVYPPIIPLDQFLIEVAEHNSVDAHDLDWHVLAIHEWEPSDSRYDDAVLDAVYCMLNAGYRETNNKDLCRSEQ